MGLNNLNSLKKHLKSCLLLILLTVSGFQHPKAIAQQCQEIFIHKSLKTAKDFHNRLESLTTSSKAVTAKDIHLFILEVSRSPHGKAIAQDLLTSLEKTQHQASRYDTTVSDLIALLKLVKGNLETWKEYFKTRDPLSDFNNRFGPSSTIGLLLQQLPESTARPLALHLGDLYRSHSKQQKKDFTKPIHILLNPKRMHSQFKKDGKSDIEFYDAYIKKVKEWAFPRARFGSQSGYLVVEIAKVMQHHLITRDLGDAFNFFGSVPNGFARPKSDYDLFHHPIPEKHPTLLQQYLKVKENPRIPDPFEMLRYQVSDGLMQKDISTITASTTGKGWRLEGSNDSAHQHFGALSHIFSFHITKEGITLRFYHNYISNSPSGKRLDAWDYLPLNLNP